MVNSGQDWGCRFIVAACAMGGAIAFSANRSFAQVTPDGSLGTQIDGNLVIRGGTTVGDRNLFHSFSSFSVPRGQTARFDNAQNIVNIFGRVTGGTPSNIQGTIQAQFSANLFLINPSGIIFGPNARLEIGGSFVGTTANGIKFGDGVFPATASPVDSNNTLLAINPSALFFNQTPAGVSVNQSTLQVPDGKDLFLVGGNVTVNGGTLVAPGGRVELGGLAAAGDVKIEDATTSGINPNRDFPRVRLRFPDGVGQANMSLTDASINVGSEAGAEFPGDISVTGNQLSIANSALTSRSANTSDFGVIRLRATGGSVLLEGSLLSTTNTASGLAGDIFINAADRVSISGSSIFSDGRAGRIFIDAPNQISLVNNSSLLTRSNDDNISELYSVIKLTAPQGSVIIDISQISTTNTSSGFAGDIGISARDSIAILNGSDIRSNGNLGRIFIGETSAPGFENFISPTTVTVANSLLRTNNDASQADANQDIPSGIISVNAISSISLLNSQLQAVTNRQGDAKGVSLQTNGGAISLDNSIIFSTVESGGRGNGGIIEIETGSLAMNNGSQLQTLVRSGGQGDAGRILIEADSHVSLDNSKIFSTVESGVRGDGGIIEIETGSLSMSNGSEMQTLVRGGGVGNAGLISIEADGHVSLTNRSRIFSTVEPGAIGNAGIILMDVGSLSIESSSDPNNASGLTTSILGIGNPGYILVQAREDVSLRGNGSGFYSISGSQSINLGDRTGGILIDARDLFIRDGAAVSVNNASSGEAGNILISTRDIIMNNRAVITAIANSGEGGNILLASEGFLLLLSNSDISTRAGSLQRPGGINGGNIAIDTRFLITAPFSSNDVDAEAFGGRGGRIDITADRLYDIEKRSLSILSNDISVTSGYGEPGQITENVLNGDPTQGLVNLPADLVDPSTLMAETCAPRGGIAERQKNRFIVTGRGGLPPDPNAAFPGEAVVNDLGTPNQERTNSTDVPNSTNPANPTPTATASPQQPEIVEAQGWVYGKDGDIIFTAQPPTVTPNSPVLTPASTCNAVSTLPQ